MIVAAATIATTAATSFRFICFSYERGALTGHPNKPYCHQLNLTVIIPHHTVTSIKDGFHNVIYVSTNTDRANTTFRIFHFQQETIFVDFNVDTNGFLTETETLR
jgi:hypothetical protein